MLHRVDQYAQKKGSDMLMKALRIGLGNLFLFFDFISRPRPLKRSAEAQAAVERAAANLSLYQFRLCPFCIRVRRTLHQLNVPMVLRDAKNNERDRQTLMEQGGKIQVPCLRIDEADETTWLYDSKAINAYLHERFAHI